MASRIAAAASLFAGSSAQLVAFPKPALAASFEEKVTEEVLVNPTLCDPSVHQVSGYIKAATGIAAPNYFFWLFESKSDPSNDPLLMWLSGGPGCSSQLALFAENGPCTVNSDGNGTTTNAYSWHKKANVMWVDQPAGVGFSSGFGTRNEAGVASNMYTFLQGFYTKLPKYKTNPFFIFGESYGGHYVPAIAHKIWEKNNAGTGLHIPLAGLSVGNGLTDPEEQYKWYAEMGHTGGVPEGGHAPSVFGDTVYNTMKAATDVCVSAIHACNQNNNNATVCLMAAEGCNAVTMMPYKLTGLNPYDMRIKCEHGNLCYDFEAIGTYLNTDSIKAELGASGKWGDCNYAVNMAFQLAGDWMHSFHTMIPELLHDGIQVLIYAGDVDFVCNWLGNKAWTKALEWNQKDDFNSAADHDWQVDGKTVARLRSAGSFHFMQMYEAGHMVPMDKPAESLAMVNAFISGNVGAHIKPAGVVV